MEIVAAKREDFDLLFPFMQQLWAANTYDREKMQTLFEEICAEKNSFVCKITDDGKTVGFCHGAFFNTFWLAGNTCYLSSLFIAQQERRKGYAKAALAYVKALAKERQCTGIILDSAFFRTPAHALYEAFGFEKACYGFELLLD